VTRRIIVHSLDHAVAAAAASAALQVPVTLQGAPGAGTYAGPGWFLAVIAEAQASHPGARIDAVIDCADEAGSALAALRAGCKRVRFSGRADVADRLGEIAAAQGAQIEGGDPVEALDLLGQRDPEAAARAWLSGTARRHEHLRSD
jgi:hypothetical protein